MNFDESPEFKKDVKRLAKRWRSIPDDIEAAKQYITPLYVELSKDVSVEEYRAGFFNRKRAAVLKANNHAEAVKIRLDVFDVDRSSPARLVFVAIKTENSIKFIELFSKNDKQREDANRIKKYYGKH